MDELQTPLFCESSYTVPHPPEHDPDPPPTVVPYMFPCRSKTRSTFGPLPSSAGAKVCSCVPTHGHNTEPQDDAGGVSSRPRRSNHRQWGHIASRRARSRCSKPPSL